MSFGWDYFGGNGQGAVSAAGHMGLGGASGVVLW